MYDCITINDKNYNERVIGKVKYVNCEQILVELPVNFKQVGTITGWFGRDKLEAIPEVLPNRLYWWVKTFRFPLKNLEIE